MSYIAWNQHKIFYRKQGDGPLLLVLPGNTASSACHQGELDHFSDRYCTASLDFLGTGQSDRAAVWAQDWWAQAASQAAALVSHLDFQDCIVMGTSGGAAIALLMAMHYPDMVRAVIADSCPERFTPEMAQRESEERRQCLPEQVQFWEFANGPDWERVVEADTAMLTRFAASGGDWAAGRLGDIRCPVLLTGSKQDETIPQPAMQMTSMYEQIPDCRLYLNAHGSHPLMWTAPQDFRAASDHFLTSLEEHTR